MNEQALLQGIVYPAQVVARGTASYLNVAVTVEAEDVMEAELAVEEITFGPSEILTAEEVEPGTYVVTVRVFSVADQDPS